MRAIPATAPMTMPAMAPPPRLEPPAGTGLFCWLLSPAEGVGVIMTVVTLPSTVTVCAELVALLVED